MSDDTSKYAFFPIKYPHLEAYYQKQKRIFWTPSDIDYRNDLSHWDRLDKDTQDYVKYLLFLFAQLDGIVNENLVEQFIKETSFCKEATMFYAMQNAVEWIHNETYSLLIKTFIRDLEEQKRGLDSIANFPEIKKIADWAFEWMNVDKPLLERIVAFACIEGVIFSSAFAGIYWVKRRNVLHGLTKANEWIARDEALHTEFAIAMYHTLVTLKKFPELQEEKVHQIVSSAIEVTEKFTRSAIKVDLIGLNADNMMKYVKCTADTLLGSLGYETLYKCDNPFDWMAVIGLPNKTNFFESKVSEYARSEVSDYTFDLDTPF